MRRWRIRLAFFGLFATTGKGACLLASHRIYALLRAAIGARHHYIYDLRRRNDADSKKRCAFRRAQIRRAAHSRLYRCLTNGFCLTLVSTFCYGLICPIDFILYIGNKFAVNCRFGEFHCSQIRHNAVIDEGE